MLSVTNARFGATIVLPAITFLFGILSIAFPSRQRCPLLISAFLCFGAGVLLAVSLLHMLPEAHAGVPDLAELSFCIGFLLLYLVDEVVHFFCTFCHRSDKAQGSVCGDNHSASVLTSSFHGGVPEQQQHILYDQNSFDVNSGSESEETELHYGNCLDSKHPRRFSGGSVRIGPQDGGRPITSQSHCKNDRPSTSYGSMSTTERNTVDAESGVHSSHKGDDMQQTSPRADFRQRDLISSSPYNAISFSLRRQNTFMTSHRYLAQQEENGENDLNVLCHTNYSPPCSQTRAGQTGLFIALTFHATLEGVAVGIEPSAEQVLLLAGALACHKVVVAFCFGLELRASGRGCLSLVGHIFLLSLGSLIGIIIGGILTENEHAHILSGPAVSIIQVREFCEFSMLNGTLM
jgi:zinc transporter ZupT